MTGKGAQSGPGFPRRRGQIASEASRFELRGESRLPRRDRGLPPPSSRLTFVRGWLRDPHHIVASWNIDDEAVLRELDVVGWGRLELRALDPADAPVARTAPGRRSGTHHLEVPPGTTLRLELGLHLAQGAFWSIAVSPPVRVPPDTFTPAARGDFMRIPPRLDLRALLAGDDPTGPGHAVRTETSAAWRLYQRLHRLATMRTAEPRGASFDLGAGPPRLADTPPAADVVVPERLPTALPGAPSPEARGTSHATGAAPPGRGDRARARRNERPTSPGAKPR